MRRLKIAQLSELATYKPRYVSTAAELDALPLDAVVVDHANVPRTKRSSNSHMGAGWTHAGNGPLSSKELANGRPMLVIFEGRSYYGEDETFTTPPPPDDTEANEVILASESLNEALFEIADKYGAAVTNNYERWQDGVYVRHVGEFIDDCVAALKRHGIPPGPELEYGIEDTVRDFVDHTFDLGDAIRFAEQFPWNRVVQRLARSNDEWVPTPTASPVQETIAAATLLRDAGAAPTPEQLSTALAPRIAEV